MTEHTQIEEGEVPSQRARAIDDLRRVLTDSYVWRALAWANIRSSYRLSSLGTLWITTTTAIFAVSIGLIYGQFFGQDMSQYMPYFVTGFITWGFISTSLTSGSNALIAYHNFIKGSQMPIVFHVLRVVQTQLIVFGHNLIVLVGIWLFFRWPLTAYSLLSLVGLALTFVFVASTTLFLAVACVRFRDIPPLIQAVVQFVFFATPIIWYPEQLRFGSVVLWGNPVAYFLMVTRDPFLGRPTDPLVWAAALVMALLALTLACAMYVRYRGRIAYWV